MNDVVNKYQNKPKDIITVPKRDNVFSDEWASEWGWNNYFVGMRYNKGLGSRPGHHG